MSSDDTSYKSTGKIPLLGEDNYEEWSEKIKARAKVKDLWDCIAHGPTPYVELVPSEPKGSKTSTTQTLWTQYEEKLADWEKNRNAHDKMNRKLNAKCYELITLHVSGKHMHLVRNAKTDSAHKLWKSIEQHYHASNPARALALRSQLTEIHQRPGEGISEYFARVELIAEQLNSIEPGAVPDKQLITYVLVGLHPAYKTVATLLTYQETSLTGTLSALRQEELRLKMEKRARPHNANYSTAGDRNGRRNPHQKTPAQAKVTGTRNKKKDPTKNCTKCGYNGHDQETCYTKPENYKKNREAALAKSKKTDESKKVHVAHVFTSRKMAKTATSDEDLMVVYRAKDPDAWLADTGCTDHMTGDRTHLTNYRPEQTPIKLAMDGSGGVAQGIGDMPIIARVNGEEKHLLLHDVLYVPGLTHNLYSIRTTLNKYKNGRATFTSEGVAVTNDDGETICTGVQHRGLQQYLMDFRTNMKSANSVTTNNYKIWHARLGHLGKTNIQKLIPMVKDMDLTSTPDETELCGVCLQGKLPNDPFKEKKLQAAHPGEIIVSDVKILTTRSFNGNKVLAVFQDVATGYTVVYPLRSKSDTTRVWKKFVARAEAETGHRVRKLYTDGGTEYINDAMKTYNENQRIHHEWTIPEASSQNGIAERRIRTTYDSVRCLLYQSGLNERFWDEAALCAVYLRNRSPTSRSKTKTPYEAWFKKAPSMKHLRIFGSDVWFRTRVQGRKTLHPRARKGIFLGYLETQKGYKVWDPLKRKVYAVRTLVADEQGLLQRNLEQHDIPRLEMRSATEEDEHDQRVEEGEKYEYPMFPKHQVPQLTTTNEGAETYPTNWTPDILTEQKTTIDLTFSDSEGEQEYDLDTGDEDYIKAEPTRAETSDDESTDQQIHAPRRSERTGKPPNMLSPLHTGSYHDGHSPATWDPRETLNPSEMEESMTTYASAFTASHMPIPKEPRTLAEARKGPDADKWERAAKKEFDALIENGTWKYVDRPTGAPILQGKWVFKVKLNPDGTIEKHKARFVVCGNRQPADTFDEYHISSPVVSYPSIRMFLGIAAARGMRLRQFDVSNAYLNGQIPQGTHIYMEQPYGYELKGKQATKVCQLIKGLYGMKQGGALWNDDLVTTLLTHGWKRLNGDPCLFAKHDKDGKTQALLFVYVDDIGVAYLSPKILNETRQMLQSKYKITEVEEEPRWILGMNLQNDVASGTLTLSQWSYVDRLLEQYQMTDCKPKRTPFPSKTKLQRHEGVPVKQPEYRALIGTFLFLAGCTRPDIASAVSQLSRHVGNPSEEHWGCAKHLLRYLNGTRTLGLVYRKNETIDVDVYCDASYAESFDCKSITGVVTRLNGTAINWCSKHQSLVADSSSGAELIATAEAIRRIRWEKQILESLGVEFKDPIKVYEDNQAILHTLKSQPSVSSRTKHYNVRYFVAREAMQNGEIELIYCPTEDMIADGLTKAPSSIMLDRLCNGTNLFPVNRDRSGIKKVYAKVVFTLQQPQQRDFSKRQENLPKHDEKQVRKEESRGTKERKLIRQATNRMHSPQELNKRIKEQKILALCFHSIIPSACTDSLREGVLKDAVMRSSLALRVKKRSKSHNKGRKETAGDARAKIESGGISNVTPSQI